MAQTDKPDADLVGWYRFEAAGDLGADASGQQRQATVAEAALGEGREGQGMVVDGKGGLEIASSEAVQAAGGFSVDLWLKFASVSENLCVIAKEDEYQLRIDPAPEGSNLSFFVNVGGSLEPRVRGPRPEPGVWYHVIATWDGEYAALWVNGQQLRVKRVGPIAPTESPVLVGRPFKWAPEGLTGTVDEVKLYRRALTDGEVLLAEFGLGEGGAVGGVSQPRSEFAEGSEGWEGRHADGLVAAEGRLRAAVHGHGSALVNRRLAIPARDAAFVSLRMAASAGQSGKLLFATTEGPGAETFPLIADGKMHSYVLRVANHPQWDGTLAALALVPSDAEAEVEVDFVRVTAEPEGPAEIAVTSFLPDRAINRAGRPCRVVAAIRNTGGPGRGLVARLAAPADVTVDDAAQQMASIDFGEERELSWTLRAQAAGAAELRLTVGGEGVTPAGAGLTLAFTPPVPVTKAEYVPEPQVPAGDLLVGAHYCPLWMQGSRSTGWEQIVPYPEREPALGWYDENDPEVTDWEAKWALEHGIDFFVYCWYRVNQGHGVEQFLSHAIHDGLFNAHYGDRLKFTIMWENQSKGQSGVASEEDLLQNLLPFWIETYFKRPNYLKVDNKPVLFIYRPEYLVDDLGSVGNVRRALDKMREACREAGFDGLTILGEYRGTERAPLQLMVDEGLDYGFQYCWPVAAAKPTPEEAVRAQEGYWETWRKLDVLPYLLTVSMGWDSTPWHPSYSIWRLPPTDFRTLCERARTAMAALPANSLGRKMVLLDNWNEFGEGHYIAPHRQYGFGYLDAVRAAFTNAPEEHTDLIPEDLGLGPYDSRYQAFARREAMCKQRVTKEGSEPGLIAWWSFDEDDGSPCALDYSGNGRGGVVENAERVPGLRGKALSCHGGSVTTATGALGEALRQITVECWLKTDLAGQTDKWFVNNVYNGATSGFRFGLSDGKLSWAIPRTSWSHHLVAPEPLPLGRWVHVAGTYDGKLMRLYMDGKECASLERRGPVLGNDYHLCLGSYERDHRAFFTGLLDEVRVHSRALTAEEVAERAKG